MLVFSALTILSLCIQLLVIWRYNWSGCPLSLPVAIFQCLYSAYKVVRKCAHVLGTCMVWYLYLRILKYSCILWRTYKPRANLSLEMNISSLSTIATILIYCHHITFKFWSSRRYLSLEFHLRQILSHWYYSSPSLIMPPYLPRNCGHIRELAFGERER